MYIDETPNGGDDDPIAPNATDAVSVDDAPNAGLELETDNPPLLEPNNGNEVTFDAEHDETELNLGSNMLRNALAETEPQSAVVIGEGSTQSANDGLGKGIPATPLPDDAFLVQDWS